MVSKINLARAGTLMVAASRVGQQGDPAFLRRMDRPADRQIDLQPKSAGTRPRSRARPLNPPGPGGHARGARPAQEPRHDPPRPAQLPLRSLPRSGGPEEWLRD